MNNLSRSALLGAGSAIALVGLPLMTSFVEAATTADPADVDALNGAIELERAGIKAYQDGAATGLLSAPVLAIAKGFIADHSAHLQALVAAVRAGGGTPSERVAHIDEPHLATQADVLRFALGVERTAASTYLSVIPEMTDRKLAGVAASILGVETTHVSVLANALGERAYPSGFVR